jgi:hypothetical protein
MIEFHPPFVSVRSMMLVSVEPTILTCYCVSDCVPMLPSLQSCVRYDIQCLIERIAVSIFNNYLSPAIHVC